MPCKTSHIPNTSHLSLFFRNHLTMLGFATGKQTRLPSATQILKATMFDYSEQQHTQMLHVWNLCLHLTKMYGKCRQIFPTWSIWDILLVIVPFLKQTICPWKFIVGTWTLLSGWPTFKGKSVCFMACKYDTQNYTGMLQCRTMVPSYVSLFRMIILLYNDWCVHWYHAWSLNTQTR